MEAVYGQKVHLYDVQGDYGLFRLVSLVSGSSRPTYVGWIAMNRVQDVSVKASHRITTLSAPVFSQPDLKTHIKVSLPLGAQICVGEETDKYVSIGDGKWLSNLHVKPLSAPEEDYVEVAQRYLGQPYVWGGNGARGVDCSGLVQMSLAVCGIDSPRDADQQEQSLGHRVDFNAGGNLPSLERGDLLFWPGHVGILSASDRLLHANATHMLCVDETLMHALKRMSESGIELRTIRRI